MKQTIILTFLLLALLAPCVVAVSVTFDNETCGIHVTMDIPADNNGRIEIPAEAFVDAAKKSRCNETPIIWASTHEYTKKASSYCAPGYCGVENVTVVPTFALTNEPIMYPQEYYTLGQQTSVDWHKISGAYYGTGQDYPQAQYLTFLELRRQTILMERQNELLAEQLRWQRNATLKCISYYNRGVCEEYAWVGGAS